MLFNARGQELSHRLLRDARAHGVLFRIDQEEAARAQSKGCGCGGRLHAARFRRKPRCGLELEKVHPDYGLRLSFCCDREGCRRRTTPPSVRFLGRRVYVSTVVVLIAALAKSVTSRRLRRLRRLVGDVSRRTVERWLQWWRETFPETSFWREHRARFLPPVAAVRLPGSLLERAAGIDDEARLVWLLRFLSPITTTSTGPPAHAS